VPGARDTARTVVIRYAVANALRFFDGDYRDGGDGVALGASVGLTALVVGAFAPRMRVRTEAGVRALEEALGFREFVSRVDGDRLRRMMVNPELFERYLPHAIAFGLERRWGKAFDELYTTEPSWYRGTSGRGFRTSSFSRSLSRMASQKSSSTGGSSRSGAGGGSRSGGGSGGGGGGGR
jgi:hypothetical protein